MIKNEIVLNALINAGWRIGRQISRDSFVEILHSEGYETSKCVIDFLEEFGGLTIFFKNLRNGLEDDDINFDIEHATHIENSERILEDYGLRIGKKLCLIGTAYRDHFCLVMSDDGSVYGGYSDFLCKIGDSGIQAIEAILLDYTFEEIP